MTPPQKGRIFISYRRADSAGYAGRIYDRLADHFGEDAIFMDVDMIEGGLDFVKVLEDATQSCDVLIALIGRQWLNIKDTEGKRRLDNPEDFVRIEIATALNRDIRVIPVLVDGIEMPRSTELPENLKPLARRNALQVNHHSFNPDTYRIIEHSELALNEAEESKFMKAQALKAAQEKAEREAAEKAKHKKTKREIPKRAAQISWALTDALQDGRPYISIDLTSKENRLLKCYSYIKSLEFNGIVRGDIKNELVKHTNRVSWSGGSNKDVGIKYIDPMGFGKINLASLDTKDFIRSTFQFETAKGSQSKDKDGEFLPFGKYTIELGLACSTEGVGFPETPITIGFEYIEEHGYHEDNVIKKVRETRKILRLLEIKPSEPVPRLKTLKSVESVVKSSASLLARQDKLPDSNKHIPPAGLIAPSNSDAFEPISINSNSVIRVSEYGKKKQSSSKSKTPPSSFSDAEKLEKKEPKSRVTPSSQKARPKFKTEYIVAMIGGAAVICVAVIGLASPLVGKWLNTTPEPTETTTFAPSATFTALALPSEIIAPTLTPTKTLTPTTTPYPEEISDTDPTGNEIPMRFVPAGEFIMGSDEGPDSEKPAHNVYLDNFYMDQYEVTNALYKACVDTGICFPPRDTSSNTRASYYGNWEYNDYPIINVYWHEAKVFCEWRGAQLPTEAQWEKAARGTDGRTYPWGEEIDCSRANYGTLDNESYCIEDTTEVGSYESSKSPYGLYDMAGNVYEWVADWYDWNYYDNSPTNNPLGPTTGEVYSLRGGSWGGSDNSARSSYRGRGFPNTASDGFGFRCAKDAP